jgi:protein transport protein SEC31
VAPTATPATADVKAVAALADSKKLLASGALVVAPTKAETPDDVFIRNALTVGDFNKAVDRCLETGRIADALIYSGYGDEKMWAYVKNYFFEHHAQGFVRRTMRHVVNRDLGALVRDSDMARWKESLDMLMSYQTSPEQFSELVDTLAARLESDDTYLQAAIICYMCSGNTDKTIDCWTRQSVSESKQAMQASGVSPAVWKVHDGIEKVSVLAQTQQHAHAESGKLLATKYSEYAGLLAAQGSLGAALDYLTTANSAPEAGSPIATLMDRIFGALGSQQQGESKVRPQCPFQASQVYAAPNLREQLAVKAQKAKQYATSESAKIKKVVVAPVVQQQQQQQRPVPASSRAQTMQMQQQQQQRFQQGRQQRQMPMQQQQQQTTQFHQPAARTFAQSSSVVNNAQNSFANRAAPVQPQPQQRQQPQSFNGFQRQPIQAQPVQRTIPSSSNNNNSNIRFHQPVQQQAPMRQAPQGGMMQQQPVVPQRQLAGPSAQTQAAFGMPSNTMGRSFPSAPGGFGSNSFVQPQQQMQQRQNNNQMMQQQQQQQMQQPARVEQKQAAPAPRAELSQAQVAMQQSLSSVSAQLEQFNLRGAEKKRAADVHKRLAHLYDRLRKNEISASEEALRAAFVAALQRKDYGAANTAHVTLVSDHYEGNGPWLSGCKTLLMLCKKYIR